jgi:hypothetical protein
MSVLPLGILASSGGGTGGPAFELITTQVLSSAASSVTFSSIPTNYKHLQLRYVAHTNSNQSVLRGRFNGDSTSANYTRHYLYGDGSSAGSAASTSNAWLDFGPLEQGSNMFAVGVVDILDYADTNKNKTTRALAGRSGSANRLIELTSGVWLSTAAVSSLTLSEAFFGQNLLTGSRFSLYGIKG